MNDSELFQKILAESLTPEVETAEVEKLIQRNPQLALTLLPVFEKQKNNQKRINDELREKLKQPPWHPAVFLRLIPGMDDRALVASANRRLVTLVDPALDPAELVCGRSVFLNGEQNMLVRTAPDLPRSGAIGSFSRFHDGRVVLKGEADQECVLDVSDELLETGLKAGDLLLYDREGQVAFERVGKESGDRHLLTEIPDVTFDDIGGLDQLIEEIIDEIDLHFFHQDLVERHRLKPIKGFLLCGSPGLGKTMVAKALANHLSNLHGVEARFLHVPPGSHRSMWYGRTEENIRTIFSQARQYAQSMNQLCLLFFDDVDHLGARGDSVSTGIDTRVLPCFLEQLDGLRPLDRVIVMGATNRPDLLDEGLLRSGRFGDKLFRIPRPGREAARDIFRKHLGGDLPWYVNGRLETPEAMIETALSAIYSPNGDGHTLATLTFRDGSRRPLIAPQVMSGALIANSVAEAKRRSCFRAIRGGPVGITTADLLAAIDRELSAIAGRLKPGPALNQMLELPPDLDVVRLEVHPDRKRAHGSEFMRTA